MEGITPGATLQKSHLAPLKPSCPAPRTLWTFSVEEKVLFDRVSKTNVDVNSATQCLGVCSLALRQSIIWNRYALT